MHARQYFTAILVPRQPRLFLRYAFTTFLSFMWGQKTLHTLTNVKVYVWMGP